jgi:hypothetical protein
VKQLVEDFARYLYLPRLKDSVVLLDAIRDGVNLLTWTQDSFGFADSFDEDAGRYKGCAAADGDVDDAHAPGLVVKPDVAEQDRGGTEHPFNHQEYGSCNDCASLHEASGS